MIVKTTSLALNTGIACLSPNDLITFLKSNFNILTYPTLFKGLENSNTIVNQVIFRAAINCKQENKEFIISAEFAYKKANGIALNRRKRFVRRIWKKTPLFAMSFIKERYKDYTEDQLLSDLLINKKYKKRPKFKKRPSSFGLRVSQIQKLAGLLRFSDVLEVERNTICNKIVGYENSLKHKLPILLTVRYDNETMVYQFPWNETETKIKTFVSLTKKFSSFKELDEGFKNKFSYGI
ncbi:hypothetical protein [Pedobacter nutrimenti]|uniref:Uncharacterized protein n=1 Tax=Pedobacter nutrimenti TaxID=1241337 RepID=A0A318UAC0_9SPHI|nr:hypothetical protein [Pedobacter nutrimenti]PYF68417.1 hypothetical protein B0O44_1121 [Pedobacter nutrimenti]